MGKTPSRKIKDHKFRIAFCDLSMPRLGGLELLEILRRRKIRILKSS